MEVLPIEILYRIAFKLDEEDLFSLRRVCRKFVRLHRPPVTNPSAAQRLPMELVQQIYGFLTASDFDAARSTCSFWNAAAHRLFIFIEQDRMRIENLTPKELVYIRTGKWPKYRPHQHTSLRELWLDDPEETSERFMHIFVDHVKTLRDTWRALSLDRTAIDLGEGTNTASVSQDGRHFVARYPDGSFHLYAMFNPGPYLRPYFNKTRMSSKSWTPSSATDFDQLDDLTDEEDDMISTPKPSIVAKKWYSQMINPFVRQKISIISAPRRRVSSHAIARYHNVKPLKLMSFPAVADSTLIDVAFISAPNLWNSTQIQLVLLVKVWPGYRVICHNLEASRHDAYDVWKIIQTVEHRLEETGFDTITVAPIRPQHIKTEQHPKKNVAPNGGARSNHLNHKKIEQRHQRSVRVSITGPGVHHELSLPFVEVCELLEEPGYATSYWEYDSGVFVVSRSFQPFVQGVEGIAEADPWEGFLSKINMRLGITIEPTAWYDATPIVKPSGFGGVGLQPQTKGCIKCGKYEPRNGGRVTVILPCLYRLDARTSSSAVLFSSITIQDSGTYIAGILQPGNEVWIWTIPFKLGPRPPVADHVSDWTFERTEYQKLIYKNDDMTLHMGQPATLIWPSRKLEASPEAAIGRRIGNIRGVKTLRWDWRSHLGGSINPLAMPDLRSQVLRLVIGTDVGMVFACESLAGDTARYRSENDRTTQAPRRWVLDRKGELMKAQTRL